MVDNRSQPQEEAPFFDPYVVLGLSRNATTDEIKATFRRLALKHHPDKPGGDTVSFKKINEAYQILNDPDKRRVYDSCHDDSINLEVLSKFASILMNIVHQKLQEKIKQRTPETANNSRKKPKTTNTTTPDTDAVPKPKRVLKCNPVVIKMTVDIEDLYNANVKKLVVKVKRKDHSTGTLGYVSVPLYISLLGHQKQYVFHEMGDDSIDSNEIERRRGDIIVNIAIESNIIPTASLDTLFCPHDIHIEHTMSLYDCLYGLDVNVPYFNHQQVQVVSKPLENKTVEYYSYVHVVEGMGLPYVKVVEGSTEQIDGTDDYVDDETIKRGDLYIYFKLHVTLPAEDVMQAHENIFKTYFNAVPSTKDGI